MWGLSWLQSTSARVQLLLFVEISEKNISLLSQLLSIVTKSGVVPNNCCRIDTVICEFYRLAPEYLQR